MTAYNILVAPGDAHGPAVVEQALKILKVVEASSSVRFHFTEVKVGKALEAETGRRINVDILERAKQSDAVVFGYEAPPVMKDDGTMDCALLSFRQALDLYANLRSTKASCKALHHLSPLKSEIIDGTDILTVRETTSGAYLGKKIEGDEYAEDSWSYTRDEIERLARVAGAVATAHDPPLQVTSVDKVIMLASSRLWRKTVNAIFAKEFPQVHLKHQLVDNAAMLLMLNPKHFNGVLLAENTFGDILSDELCVIPGAIGLIPSATLRGTPGKGKVMGFYEPMHGPGISDVESGYSNPVGSILSVAMMLSYSFNMGREAAMVEKAVSQVLDPIGIKSQGLRTRDLGGNSTTNEMGDAICEALRTILLDQ